MVGTVRFCLNPIINIDDLLHTLVIYKVLTYPKQAGGFLLTGPGLRPKALGALPKMD